MAKINNTNQGSDNIINTSPLIVNVYNKIIEFQNKWNEFEQNRIKHGESATEATIKGAGLAAFYITVGEAIDKLNPVGEAFDMLEFSSNYGLDLDAGAVSAIKESLSDFKQENTELIEDVITPDVIEMTSYKGIFMNTDNHQIYMPKQGLQLGFDNSENSSFENIVTINSIKVINPNGSMSIREISQGLNESPFHEINVDKLLFNYDYKNINDLNDIKIDYNLDIKVPKNYTSYIDENGIKIETGLISTGKMKVLITNPNTNTVTEYLQDVNVGNEVTKTTYLEDGTTQSETLNTIDGSIVYPVNQDENESYELNIIQDGENLTLTKTHITLLSDEGVSDTQAPISIPLTSKQTISHIAQQAGKSTIDLAEYNNISLEEAKSLHVGTPIRSYKGDPEVIKTPDGNIKLFENYDGTDTAILPKGITGEKTIINFDEDTSTLLYGDRTNPDKITYVDDVTNNYVEISKDSAGSYYKSLESNNDFTVSYDNTKTVTSIEIHSDNVNLEEIANLTTYTKEDLQAFNFLNGDTVNSDTNFQLPASKELDIEGGYDDISHFTTKDGHDIFVVPQEDKSTITYSTFTDGNENQASYKRKIA